MTNKLDALGPRLRKQMMELYRGMGIECPIREIEEHIEDEMLEVFKLHTRRETGKALGIPMDAVSETDDD